VRRKIKGELTYSNFVAIDGIIRNQIEIYAGLHVILQRSFNNMKLKIIVIKQIKGLKYPGRINNTQ
jgi:hypothetical protein